MKKNSIYEIALSAILLTLLIIGSKITIPLGIINLTMQLPIVFLILFIVKKRTAILIIFTYIFMGLIGIPVFSTGGGFQYIYQPSFGFILGFLVCAILTPVFKKNKWLNLISSFIALLIVYAFGATYMYMILNYYMDKSVDVLYVLNAGVTPFILKDSICAVLACALAIRLNPVLENTRLNKYNTINKEEIV